MRSISMNTRNLFLASRIFITCINPSPPFPDYTALQTSPPPQIVFFFFLQQTIISRFRLRLSQTAHAQSSVFFFFVFFFLLTYNNWLSLGKSIYIGLYAIIYCNPYDIPQFPDYRALQTSPLLQIASSAADDYIAFPVALPLNCARAKWKFDPDSLDLLRWCLRSQWSLPVHKYLCVFNKIKKLVLEFKNSKVSQFKMCIIACTNSCLLVRAVGIKPCVFILFYLFFIFCWDKLSRKTCSTVLFRVSQKLIIPKVTFRQAFEIACAYFKLRLIS